MSTASSKHLYLHGDIWRVYFSFCNNDDNRFYSNSHTKARASYLSYEKKTDIRGCDVYKDVARQRRRNSVEFQRCDGPCSLYWFNLCAVTEHKNVFFCLYIYFLLFIFCIVFILYFIYLHVHFQSKFIIISFLKTVLMYIIKGKENFLINRWS